MTNGYTKLADKISRKILTKYLVIYVVIFILIAGITLPFLFQNAVNKASSTVRSICIEMESLQENMADSVSRIQIMDTLTDAILTYQSAPTPSNSAKIDLCLGRIAANDSHLLTICMEDSSGNFFSPHIFSTDDKKSALHSYPGYIRQLNLQHSSWHSPLLKNIVNDFYSDYNCFAYSRNIVIGSAQYTVTAIYNANNYLQLCNSISESSFSVFACFNHNRECLYASNDFPHMDYVSASLSETKKTAGMFRCGLGMIFYRIIPSTACFVVAYCSYFQLLFSVLTVTGTILVLYLLSPFLYNILLKPIISSHLQPLTTLTDAMKDYHAGNKIFANIDTNDEIQIAGDTFNQMIDKIELQVEQIREKEKQHSVVSYKLLATQVDPHFIYNTMNIINIKAKNGKMQDVIDINNALGKILRERLNSKLSIFETVRNEMDTLFQYCMIIKYREQNHIDIHFDVDEALNDNWIPKNILQPLVENAYFHAFSNESHVNGEIGVMIYSMEHEMIIEVSDNGNGMSEERISELLENSYSIYADKKPHIGINNIRERLHYIFGDCQNFMIQSSLGYGTTIIITIPLLDQLPNQS